MNGLKSSIGYETVSDARLIEKIARLVGIVFQLFAQHTDIYTQVFHTISIGRIPNMSQYGAMREHPARRWLPCRPGVCTR